MGGLDSLELLTGYGTALYVVAISQNEKRRFALAVEDPRAGGYTLNTLIDRSNMTGVLSMLQVERIVPNSSPAMVYLPPDITIVSMTPDEQEEIICGYAVLS